MFIKRKDFEEIIKEREELRKCCEIYKTMWESSRERLEAECKESEKWRNNSIKLWNKLKEIHNISS